MTTQHKNTALYDSEIWYTSLRELLSNLPWESPTILGDMSHPTACVALLGRTGFWLDARDGGKLVELRRLRPSSIHPISP